MRSSFRARLARIGAAAALALASLAPAAAPTGAADPLVFRAGTDQDVGVLNPFSSVTVADFEAFTLNYDLLANFGQDLEPVPGFADKWSVSEDGLTWTFHIRDGMKWSDGEAATSADALYTYQLILDATAKSAETEEGYSLGQGGLEPYVVNAGVTAVSAPDDSTFVVTTEFPSLLILQAYVPILPEHIWSKYSMDEIASATGADPFLNEPPVVGTGPYQAIEWSPGEFIRFGRNPNYWGEQKGAEDEVILQHFADADTMVQALKTGQVDYVRGVLPDQFAALKNEPDITTVEGFSNGYSEICFNTYTKPIPYGGASTTALQDPKFRDALAYAVDQAKLVEVTLGGHGVPGDTIVPPYHTLWHVAPDHPRTFNLDEAARRLDAAGYTMGPNGKRLDKEGKEITLRVTWPDSEAEHQTDAEFIKEWWESIGIGVDPYVTEEGKLIDDVVAPEGGGTLPFDIELWGWVGDPDPTSLLNVLRTEEIGSYSDSQWSNARYDELFLLQRKEGDQKKRFEYIKEMQNLAYDEAPYIIMYYDSELHAYRTDRFGGWQNQPAEGGTPLFGYGSGGYDFLTDATAQPSAAPSEGAPSAEPTQPPSGGDGGGGDSTPLIVGAVVLVVVVAVALILMRRRGPAAEEE